MPPPTLLSGSKPHSLFSIQRLSTRYLSSISGQPEPPSSSSPTHPHRRFPGRPRSTALRWVSGVAVGSTLGALYYNNNVDFGGFDVLKRIRGVVALAQCSCNPTEDSSMLESDQFVSFKRPRFLFGDAYRRKIFFNYEKRIRLRSPPEKVFEYFASVQSPDGEILMKPGDLMRAIVPVFPPSESDLVRDGYLKGERAPGDLRCAPSEFFMLFDVNNDGLISFKEYIFFVTLLSIPESSFSVAFKMFDTDDNGEIDREEFKKVMALMRSQNRQGAAHTDGLRAGIKIGHRVKNGGLVEFFFGKDGQTRLPHGKFVQFLRHLHDEILRLEFAHYDYKSRGTISAKDFALSMVASADIRNVNKLLDRVDEINHDHKLHSIRISEDEFRKFAELRGKLGMLSLALFTYGQVSGLLTKEDFQRAASQVCGVHLSDNVVDVIFHVFDENCDGGLSIDEFVRVLKKRERDIAQPVETGFLGFFSCCRTISCLQQQF